MQNIEKTSRQVRQFFQLLYFLIPAITILFWVFASPDGSIQMAFGLKQMTLTPGVRFLGALASLLIPNGILLYGLHQLIRIFKSYEKMEIFTLENVRRYRKLAYILFAWVVGREIYNALISVILTMKNLDYHVVNLSFTTQDLVVLITGCIVLVMSKIMIEGHRLANEEAHTV